MKPFLFIEKTVKAGMKLSLLCSIKVSGLLILMLSLPCMVSSQCQVEQNGFIFYHPYFSGISWGSSDNLQISIPPAICNSDPIWVAMAGNSADAIAVFVSEAGVVSLINVNYTLSPSCFCCKPELIAGDPITTDIVINTGSAPAVLQMHDTLLIASVAAPLRIAVFAFDETGAVLSRDTINLQSTNGLQGIQTLHLDSLERGLWAGGSGGLIRFVPYTTGFNWSDEISFDISETESLTVVMSDFAASKRGALFTRNNDSFVSDGQLDLSIENGCNSWVAGDGKIAIRRNDSWKIYTGLPDLINANLIHSDMGLVLEWINKSWNFQTRVLEDNPTRIESISPVLMEQYINGPAYIYQSYKVETFTVYFQDPDSNTQLPELKIISSFEEKNLFNGLAYSLSGMNEYAECTIGSARLIADSLRFTLRPDSIIWEGDFATGVIDFTCGNCFWSNRHLRFAQAWLPGKNTILLLSGPDSFSVKTNESVQIRNRKSPSISGKTSISHSNGKLTCRLENVMNQGGKISVFSLTGKMILSIPFSQKQSLISIPFYSAQSVLIRIAFKNGEQIERIVPCVQ